jgi:hypothetical protein
MFKAVTVLFLFSVRNGCTVNAFLLFQRVQPNLKWFDMGQCPRCCGKPEDAYSPCYASVLAFGLDGLKPAVKLVEANQGGLVSCFTGWCCSCNTTYLLETDAPGFPTRSAHHTHKLTLLESLRREKIFSPV